MAACLTDPLGGGERRAKMATGAGLAGEVPNQSVSRPQAAQTALCDRLLEGPHILVLTDQRMLATKRSSAFHQPTKTVCEWRLDEIVGLEVSKAGLMSYLDLIFSDQSTLCLEVVMISKPERMALAWQQLMGSS